MSHLDPKISSLESKSKIRVLAGCNYGGGVREVQAFRIPCSAWEFSALGFVNELPERMRFRVEGLGFRYSFLQHQP